MAKRHAAALVLLVVIAAFSVGSGALLGVAAWQAQQMFAAEGSRR